MSANLWSRTIRNRAVAAVVVFGLALGLAGCNRLKARDMLNKGVAEYTAGHYDAAVENFKQAKELDPELLNARLYLATAYATQYIPGAPSEENVRVGQQAVTEFEDVLSVDPNNLAAIDGIGSILFQMAGTPFSPEQFLRSKEYHLKHIELSPNDPEPYYWVGVINWTLAYRANSQMRQTYNAENPRRQIKDLEPLPANLRQDFTSEFQELVDEGMRMLDKAIELRPNYADAMAYKSLLLRQKADMIEDTTMRAQLETQADQLLEQSRQIKAREAEEAAKG